MFVIVKTFSKGAEFNTDYILLQRERKLPFGLLSPKQFMNRLLTNSQNYKIGSTL